MRKYLLRLACPLLLAATPAWCTDPPDFRQDWLQLLKTGDPRERSMALESLGFPDCRSKEGMESLRLLSRDGLQDNSATVRETALARLRWTLSPDHHGGCQADNELMAALRQALRDPSPRVREESLRILGMTKTGRVIPEISALLHDKEFTVRQQAAAALGRIGDSQALPLLLALLPERKEWQDALVQQEALNSIRKIVIVNHKADIHGFRSGDKSEEKFEIAADVFDNIRMTMIRVADDPWLRREAFEFFASIATDGARDLLQSATKDTDPTIRKLAYDGISRLNTTTPTGNSCGYEAIAAALRDQQPGIRVAAFAKLPACSPEIERPVLSAHLVNGINDANREVRAAALAEAASLGGVEVLPALVGTFDVEPYETRKKAMEAFLAIAHGDRPVAAAAVTGSFVAMAGSPSGTSSNEGNIIIFEPQEEVPAATGRSSRRREGKPSAPEHVPKAAPLETQAVEIILASYASLSLTGKITALEALDKLDDLRIRPFAISLLDDPQPRIQIHAIMLLSKSGIASVVPQIFRSAQKKDWELRYAAISSLLEAEKLPEEYSLARLAESRELTVRESLVLSIQQYIVRHNNKTPPAIRDLMAKMLDDQDFTIRQKVTWHFQDSFDRSSIDRLANILAKDGNCSNAAIALAKLGDSRGMDALYEVGKGVCDAKKIAFTTSKREAAVALRNAKDPRATRLLCDMLERGNDDDYQVVIQLGATCDKSAAPCLVTYGKKRKLGREVISALGKIASPEALDYLKESLDTYQYNPEVLKETILAIAVTPGTRALDILLEEIRYNSKSAIGIRSALADRALRDAEALSYLFRKVGIEQQALGSVSVDIGFRAAPALPWQKQIIALAEGSERNVRMGAIIALSSFHDRLSREFLEKLATDNDQDLAVLAKQSLGTRIKRKEP